MNSLHTDSKDNNYAHDKVDCSWWRISSFTNRSKNWRVSQTVIDGTALFVYSCALTETSMETPCTPTHLELACFPTDPIQGQQPRFCSLAFSSMLRFFPFTNTRPTCGGRYHNLRVASCKSLHLKVQVCSYKHKLATANESLAVAVTIRDLQLQ